jgi:hypothetical protein
MTLCWFFASISRSCCCTGTPEDWSICTPVRKWLDGRFSAAAAFVALPVGVYIEKRDGPPGPLPFGGMRLSLYFPNHQHQPWFI